MSELDLIDIHFQKIMKELLMLNAMLESHGDVDSTQSNTNTDLKQLQNDI